jgi:signal transduction histidine kinase
MNAEQALKILARLEQAAPPPTAAKIAEVAGLLENLERDKARLVAMQGQAIADANERARQALSADLESGELFLDESVDNGFAGTGAFPGTLAQSEPTDPEDIILTETEEILIQLDEALRVPLEIIRKQISGVLAGEIGRFRADQYAVFEAIAGSNDTAIHLLDNVTQMVALSHGLLPMDTLVFAAPLLAREAFDAMQSLAKASEHTLTIRVPDGPLQAEGDYQRVLTILTDMLNNAIHYSPQGSSIEVSVEDLGSHVLFSVADSGIGLSEDDLLFVGKPFWRAQHQDLVRQQPGTGLRLFISRQMLALQGGELIFSGEEGVGSTFSFTLPAANAPG